MSAPSTHRTEIKFLLNAEMAAHVRSWARHHLVADPHGRGPFGDEYEITSLYFDTTGFDVFHRRGSFARAKYRIRRYEQSACAFLERKLRTPTVLFKRRTQIALHELARIEDPFREPWAGDWFVNRLVARNLEPVCQVRYSRMARDSADSQGAVRLTVDRHVQATAAAGVAFMEECGSPVLTDRQILELKFAGHLPAMFRRLIEECAFGSQKPSKYRAAMAALTGFGLVDEWNLAPPSIADANARVS